MKKEVAEVFTVDTDARTKAITLLKEEVPIGDTIYTCQVDDRGDGWEITQFQFQLQPEQFFENNPAEYQQPEKLLAVSDLEGNFYALQSLLLGNGVIDTNGDWTFGSNHLVILGDLIDRSYNVLPCLWLIYKLDVQAKQFGGAVHYLLGNHELMNFQEDYRYLHAKYRSSKMSHVYRSLFDKTSVLANWMVTKNAIERIGNYLFVHAGISPELEEAKLTMNEINSAVKASLFGITGSVSSKDRLIAGSKGPLWYRGLVMPEVEYFPPEEEDVDRILKTYGAGRMVIGHTMVDVYTGLFEGKVIAIDIEQPVKKGSEPVYGLWLEGDRRFVVNDKGDKVNFD